MDSPPADVLVMLIGFALPLDIPRSSTSVVDVVWRFFRERKFRERTVLEKESVRAHQLSAIRRSLSWVASLRSTNRQWRALLDDDKESIWYHVATSLGLGPPRQLYSGGNYLDVCKNLLMAEDQKVEAHLRVADKSLAVTPCSIERPIMYYAHADHPHPERPFVVLPPDLMKRVASNAKALENFLGSVNFYVLVKYNKREQWAESALNRYKMFLHLKKANPSVWLVPTVDIEFCWLAHIFRTEKYWHDMNALGIDPSHSLCLNSYGEVASFSEAVIGTAALWEADFGTRFPLLPKGAGVSRKIWNVVYERKVNMGMSELHANVCRNDPSRFFPKMGPEILNVPSHVTLPDISLKMEDIEADLTWFRHLQRAFRELSSNANDVMRGRGADSLILDQVLPSYERFLNLCCQQKITNLAPPLILDLVWHAHQMEPVRYRDECLALFNSEFRHHPWPRGPGVMGVLSDDFKCAWKEAYGTPIDHDWKFFINRNPVSNQIPSFNHPL